MPFLIFPMFLNILKTCNLWTMWTLLTLLTLSTLLTLLTLSRVSTVWTMSAVSTVSTVHRRKNKDAGGQVTYPHEESLQRCDLPCARQVAAPLRPSPQSSRPTLWDGLGWFPTHLRRCCDLPCARQVAAVPGLTLLGPRPGVTGAICLPFCFRFSFII